MSEKKFYEDSTFWTGCATYYIMLYCILFWPVLTIAIEVGWRLSKDPWWQMYWGIIAGLITLIAIWFLATAGNIFYEKNIYGKLLLGLYFITLYPFLTFIKWIYGSQDWQSPLYEKPFAGMDWIPLW